jgi:hypothetical protein
VPVLLDVTDTRKRLVQHGAIVVAIGLLLAAMVPARTDNLGIAIGLIAGGLAMFAVTAVTSQWWAVVYRGHHILLQNNPLRGEKMFVDGVLAAKGRIGIRSEMRAKLASGEGDGDEIVARTTAGLLSYRCRIEVVNTAG